MDYAQNNYYPIGLPFNSSGPYANYVAMQGPGNSVISLVGYPSSHPHILNGGYNLADHMGRGQLLLNDALRMMSQWYGPLAPTAASAAPAASGAPTQQTPPKQSNTGSTGRPGATGNNGTQTQQQPKKPPIILSDADQIPMSHIPDGTRKNTTPLPETWSPWDPRFYGPPAAAPAPDPGTALSTVAGLNMAARGAAPLAQNPSAPWRSGTRMMPAGQTSGTAVFPANGPTAGGSTLGKIGGGILDALEAFGMNAPLKAVAKHPVLAAIGSVFTDPKEANVGEADALNRAMSAARSAYPNQEYDWNEVLSQYLPKYQAIEDPNERMAFGRTLYGYAPGPRIRADGSVPLGNGMYLFPDGSVVVP